MTVQRKLILFMIFLTLLAACTREAPLSSSLPTAPIELPTPAITSTPPPTPTVAPSPTPLPAKRVESGDQALFNGDWETALTEYEQAYKNSNDAEIKAAALLGSARARWMSRNLYETNRTLENLIKDYPFFSQRAQAYFLLARLREAQKRYAEAAEAYTKYLELKPGLIDAYILDLRGDAQYAAAQYSAAAQDYQSALESTSRLDGVFLRMKMARAYSLAGDYPTALTIYDDVQTRASDDNTRALAYLRKGEIYAQLGQSDQANAAYLEAVQNFPTSYHSYSALVALVDAGVKVNELQRGIVDYYAGQYGVAQAAFDRYLQNNPADPATALYFYGLSARKLGSYEAAIQQWERVIGNYPDHPYWDEAWEEKAYTLWAFMNQYKPAMQTLLDFVEKAPLHPRAAEFLFDAALIAERDNQLDQAAQVWDRVAREYPNDERAARSLFLMGIAQYRLGEFPKALDSFQRHFNTSTSISDRSAAQFWVGKCYLALEDAASARVAWEKAAEIDPTGYYSERAQDMLYNRPPFDPPLSYDLSYDLQRERKRAEDWMRDAFSLSPEIDLSGLGELADLAALKRGEELWHLGLYDDARSEFENVRLQHLNDPITQYRLANYLLQLGAYRPAIMAGRQVLSLAGMSDADTLDAPIYFNHLRFGIYFSDLILPLAKQYNFHPLFLYSVVRQESLFEGFVRSSAGASGLMQIIPATGQDIAERLGWPQDYSSEDLSRPLVNLTFGVAYLDAQRTAFNGDLYAALAAYNGGPENARQWSKLASSDQDLFLEVIRYAETRNYIRGVYELFNIYRLLYERTP